MREQRDFTIKSLGPANRLSPIEMDENPTFLVDGESLVVNPHLSHLGRFIRSGELPEAFELAGPRRRIYFASEDIRAAIVTCGGLCPGINSVIRALVNQLWYHYGARQIAGIRYGYHGLAQNPESPPLALEPGLVTNIHRQGGTVLGTSRGTPSTSEIVDSLERLGINQLFTIGGDGTMRGAAKIFEECQRRNLEVAVIGIPKTIDNDIPYVRRSFGFETAVGIACDAIQAAHEEARGAYRGIGIVRLMGRSSGFIAASAVLAAGDANYCLVPEVPFTLEGNSGLFASLSTRLEEKRHAVIAVAEGAGQALFDGEESGRDASGNPKLQDIGLYLKSKLNEHFAKAPVTIKYIDPSYSIRAAAANPADQLFCARLAQNAAHAAMSGKTGLLIGYWHGRQTHVPLQLVSEGRQSISPTGELWFNVLQSTGQPRHMC